MIALIAGDDLEDLLIAVMHEEGDDQLAELLHEIEETAVPQIWWAVAQNVIVPLKVVEDGILDFRFFEVSALSRTLWQWGSLLSHYFGANNPHISLYDFLLVMVGVPPLAALYGQVCWHVSQRIENEV